MTEKKREGFPEPPENGAFREDTTESSGENASMHEPLVRYSLHSDCSNRIEVAVWAHMWRSVTGAECERFTVTATSSYKADEGWVKLDTPDWRVHDLPVLLFLLQKAHSFCLDRRTSDSSAP